MIDKSRQILVTSALPYANASIHLGHMVEHVQTDIWVRFQRLRGHEVIAICASDAHGTPAMLSARKAGVSPEELTERYRAEQQRDFARFHIHYDNYYTTHSPENRELVERIFRTLDDRGLIARRTVRQAYDAEAGMFLPDRFVRGTCPSCGAADQYGDNCEVCGATYSPADLKDARSVLTGTAPVERESEHLFFRLGEFTESLRAWHAAGHVHESVGRKLKEWFDAGLRDWDISRDAPYFGFPIPGTDGQKFFYVWMDAPVGYMASFLNLCNGDAGRARGLDFDAWWGKDSETELYHFIGKDIIYFHTLFWPAVLEGAGFRRPTAVYAHGFLTVNGQKMSKSRGTFIAAETWLAHLQPEPLRYYFAVRLGPGLDDLDLNLGDFVSRVNSDLVGKFVNLASRCAGFIGKRFGGRLADTLDAPELQQAFVDAGDSIAEAYEGREYSRAMREIMALADRANRYIDEHKPWILARDEASLPRVQAVCTQGLNLFRLLLIYLKPVLPGLAEQAEAFLGRGELCWTDRLSPLLGLGIGEYEPLMLRVDPAAVARMLEAPMESTPGTAAGTAAGKSAAQSGPTATPTAGKATKATAGAAGESAIDIAEFQRIDLRVATVLAAELVEGADKLVRLRLDVGPLGERTVLSGIRAAYPPATLVGRQVVLVANLKPREMRFGTSEGMVLAAGGEAGLFLIGADEGAVPGMQVT